MFTPRQAWLRWWNAWAMFLSSKQMEGAVGSNLENDELIVKLLWWLWQWTWGAGVVPCSIFTSPVQAKPCRQIQHFLVVASYHSPVPIRLWHSYTVFCCVCLPASLPSRGSQSYSCQNTAILCPPSHSSQTPNPGLVGHTSCALCGSLFCVCAF